MSRTRITRLVMHGFKSFAKRTELEFDEQFNVIIGPNGSGKSNVLDALCFVLGKSGAKGLRAEKSANLIYNGGKTKKPATKAEVSVFFENTSRVFPVPDKEVKVSRILTPKGTSTYKINDKTHTRQQVVDLLASARIDPDGYNIILQGDIVRFVEMSGVERRQVIEQIAGIDQYEEKRQKTENELDKTAGKLKEADILIAERKAHLDELRVDRDQAIRYRELEANIHSYRATILHRKSEGILDQKRKLDEQRASIEAQIATYDQAIAKRREDIARSRERLDDITAEIERKGEKEQLELQREIENLKVELTRKESRVSVLETELSNFETRRGQLNEELSEIDESIAKASSTRSHLEKERSLKTKELSDVDEMIERFKAKHKIENDDGVQSKIDEIDTKTEELQREMLDEREKHQSLLRDKDKAEFNLEAITRQKEKVKDLESEHRKEIEAIKEKKKLFKDTVREIEKLLTEDGRHAQENARLRARLSQVTEERSKLEGQLTQLRASSTASKAVEAIISNKKRFKGVHGTVFELVSVSRTNALALETAAGARLNAIVVDDEKVAKTCIEFLRSQKIGTATFLPMSKIKAGKDRESAVKHKGKDGVIGLARSLAKHDATYSEVIRYVFSDTLIVRDLDVARSLGIGSARFVTREGDIVEASGAMSGGFRKKAQGALSMGQLVEQLEELEREEQDANAALTRLAATRAELEANLNDLKVRKSELEGEIIKGEKSLHLADSDLDADDDKERSLKNEIRSIDAQLKDISSAISKRTRELTDLKVERQKLKNQIAEQKNPRILAELQAFQLKHQQIRERIVAIDAQIGSSQNRLDERFTSEKRKITQILKQIDSDEKKFAKELEKTKADLAKGRETLGGKEESAKAFYEAFKELFRERNDVSDALRAHESELEASESSKREQERRLNTLSLKIAEQAASIAAIEEESKEYSDATILSEEEGSTVELQAKIASFEKLIADLGNVNLKALDIYDEVEKHYEDLLAKKEKLEREIESIRKLIAQIEEKKRELFMKTFDVVNRQFQDFFGQLSVKGSAYLEIENPEDPFAGGVFIKVNLSGKKYLDIRSLSGGEKTMTALAFISAIQEHEPAPFYILDEVDAALDKKNSEKLGEMVLRYSKRAQYVMISHNDVVIGKAATIYGVSMNEHDASNVVSLRV
ncbi:MAG: chromosome segregation protein SMC [Candidatus Woesearchaeota archaeon]